jgi:hypothetical protein
MDGEVPQHVIGLAQAHGAGLVWTGNILPKSERSAVKRLALTRKVIYMTNEPEEIPAGLSPYQAAIQLRAWALRANNYSRGRKNRFRILASGIKLLSLVLSGAATIILGLQTLSLWAGLRSPALVVR